MSEPSQMPVNRIKFHRIVIIRLTFYTTNVDQKDDVRKSHRLSVCLKNFSLGAFVCIAYADFAWKVFEANKNHDADETQWHPHLLLHNGHATRAVYRMGRSRLKWWCNSDEHLSLYGRWLCTADVQFEMRFPLSVNLLSSHSLLS